MSAHQGAQILRRLIVGGMRFVQHMWQRRDDGTQCPNTIRQEVDDLVMVEFHAGLHHQTDDAWPGFG